MDFVLVNSQFRFSVLDTRVFHSTYHVSDHEMVVSTMRIKIRAKCLQSRVPLHQTTDLSPNSQIQFRSTLAEGLHHVCQSESPELSWNDFKAAMSDAYKTLPELLKKRKEDWVTDQLLNLSNKKKEAWLLLCGVGRSDNSLKLKYHHL